MVFRYFRTMFLRLIEGSELMLCEAPSRSYNASQLRSKANVSMDASPKISAREASAASAARFKRGYRRLTGRALARQGHSPKTPRIVH